MAARNRKASLAEMMGNKASETQGLRLEHLQQILGDAMPELPKTPVGRHRLMRALQQRFGANYRSLPGIKDLVSEFDGEIEFERKVAQMRSYKPKGK